MMPVRGLSRISRIVNLSFQVSGLKEQSAAIQTLTSSIQNLIQLLIKAMLAYRGLTMVMASNPFGWLILGIAGLSTVAGIQGALSSTETEEYRSRSPR